MKEALDWIPLGNTTAAGEVGDAVAVWGDAFIEERALATTLVTKALEAS